MADRDQYRGYGSPSGRYYENREYDRSGGQGRMSGQDLDREDRSWFGDDGDRYRNSARESGRGGREDDRGFFERAGEEIRSWFGDDDGRGRDSHRSEDRGRYGQGGMGSNYGSDRGMSRQGSSGYEAGDSRYGGSGDYRSGGMGGMGSSDYGRGRSHPHDDHYREWRQQQMSALDRDYEEYRRENRDKFHNEFSNWRGQRQQQRSSMQQAREHMDAVGSDGDHLGTVDKIAGDRIILTKNDPSAGGHHHSIPCSWIQSVDDKVTINKSAADARRQWQDEESRRALFEGDQRQSEGAHFLNRSFSGTYEKH